MPALLCRLASIVVSVPLALLAIIIHGKGNYLLFLFCMQVYICKYCLIVIMKDSMRKEFKK